MTDHPALEPCPKCNGVGSYMYDENHGKLCEVCCPHDQGWQLLREHYGESNGKYACKRGCGETKLPEELGLEMPQFVDAARPAKPALDPVAPADRALMDEAREAFANLLEYWNRDRNDTAMFDACWHTINVAHATLAKLGDKK